MTPKNNKRAVNRRARQTKASGSSDLTITGSRNTTWNVNAMRIPHMTRLNVKDNKIFEFIQSSTQGIVLNSLAVGPVGHSRNYTTSDIVQFSSFSAVFDQYRIKEIEVWFTPSGPGTVSGYVKSTPMRSYSVIDYDDSNVLTSVNSALQYENCQVGRLDEGHYRRFEPHIAIASYGGAFTQFMNRSADWIDVASTSVQHYGFKFIVDATVADNDIRYDSFTRIKVQFRNVF